MIFKKKHMRIETARPAVTLKQTRTESCPRPHRQEVIREVPPVVDASVHGDEAVQRGLVLHTGVVEAGVQHDDGK